IVLKVQLEGAITPSSLDLLSNALDQAEERNAVALIVAMDTPGGLMTSMDKMLRRILSSPVPVLTYISPSGAACGSAGVYILYASHLAAMTPASNIGSATPVQMSPGGGGGPGGEEEKKPSSDAIPELAGTDDKVNLKRKIINHSVAQIKSLAEFHGRDPKFAEQSITKAENITASQALKRNVIEIIAENDEDLLNKANGRTIRMVTGKVKLDLEDVEIITLDTDFRQNFLKLIADPNIATILMMIGTLGILAEIQYPGSIFPGVAGVISLILGLYAMHSLSLSYAGFGLILVGIICFILEVSIMSYGLLTVAGIISMVIGALMLADSGDEMARVSFNLVITSALAVGGLSAFMVYKAAETMRRKPSSGDDYLKGIEGIAKSDITSDIGTAFINGEIWSALSTEGTISQGSKIVVDSRDGLILKVKKKEG
ncbi:MAG: nodulation protein NfeD, partial [Leptospira sp.]|nr:nodulation protein NfeD [Leptospira sp.]